MQPPRILKRGAFVARRLLPLAVLLMSLCVSSFAVGQPLCVIQQAVFPAGVTAEPGETLQPLEHHLTHASTHLQGTPSTEKIAPAIHLPGQTSSLAEMRTIVIVNNPSATLPLDVNIEYYDPTGTLVGLSTPATILPEGHYQELAAPLTGSPWGTVRVVTRNSDDPPFVGATMFHTYSIGVAVGDADADVDATKGIGEPGGEPGEYEYFRQTHFTRVGAASMQQLQVAQDDKNELFWGPLPISNSAGPLSWDFMDGNCPLMMVTNPNPFPTTINVFILDNLGNTLGLYPVALNPFASWVDMDFFNFFVSNHTGVFPYDADVLMYIASADPIIGQGVMFDFFGQNMDLMGRLRMGSTMMSNTRATTLVSPELVVEPALVATNTLIGIANVSFGDIGPITIEYRDRNGTITNTDVIPTFPVLSTLRIGPGSPRYPAAEFAGSVTIRSCLPGLTGWSMRTTEHPGPPGQQQTPRYTVDFELRKAWGEILDGANGVEPGLGFEDSGVIPFRRKVGPLNLVSRDPNEPGSVPGYNHVFNNAVSNAGPYWFRSFDSTGLDLTDTTLQPFAGIRAGSTSFTYLDNTVPLVLPGTVSQFVTTKFVHLFQGTTGVNALGGFTYDWPWTGSPLIPFPGGGAPYGGPGDVVPRP